MSVLWCFADKLCMSFYQSCREKPQRSLWISSCVFSPVAGSKTGSTLVSWRGFTRFPPQKFRCSVMVRVPVHVSGIRSRIDWAIFQQNQPVTLKTKIKQIKSDFHKRKKKDPKHPPSICKVSEWMLTWLSLTWAKYRKFSWGKTIHAATPCSRNKGEMTDSFHCRAPPFNVTSWSQ